ncbi:MAG: IclR family transcriptional regulator [Chloroflexi bacterium]|nr:IclR family transcriptional regulator [Chloroflexota bacterium]
MSKKQDTSRSDVVKKAGKILKAFSRERSLIGVRELAEIVNLPKSTVQRLLTSLADEGLIYQDPATRRYSLGAGILVLAGVVLSHMDFRRIALPFMTNLSAKWQETIDLDILEGTHVIIVEQIAGQYALSAGSPLARRLPAQSTSTGKVLLAYAGVEYVKANFPEEIPSTKPSSNVSITREQLLRELEIVRNEGIARSREEREEFVYAIGVPIWDSTDKVIAALSLSGFVARIDKNEKEIIKDLKKASREISEQLGYRFH